MNSCNTLMRFSLKLQEAKEENQKFALSVPVRDVNEPGDLPEVASLEVWEDEVVPLQ